jgi:hypothetical protein
MRTTRTLLPLVAGGLLVAACSSGGGESADTTVAPTTTIIDKPIITSATTAPPTTAPERTTTTTTEVEYDRMPLTGEILEDDAAAPDRPALVVKIDNVPPAWPQAGLNAADIVFEEIINDASTRFAVVFHSQDAGLVGPVRSGRLQDVDLLGSLNRPLFAWSGGNPIVTDAIANSDLRDLNWQRNSGLYRRDGSHGHSLDGPNNVFSTTEELFAQAPPDAEPPTPVFDYLPPDESFEGEPAAGLEVALDSMVARWEWSPETKEYLRFSNGTLHEVIDAGQFTTNNIVVLQMEYVPSPADARSPDAVTVAKGPAWVFSNGRFVEGQWERKGRTDGFTLTTGSGKDATALELPPGRTVVEMTRNVPEGVPVPIPVPES